MEQMTYIIELACVNYDLQWPFGKRKIVSQATQVENKKLNFTTR